MTRLAAWSAGFAAALLLAGIATRGTPLDDTSDAFVAYHWASPIVDWPLQRQLLVVPELKGIEPASDQSALQPLRDKVAANVDAYLRDFLSTSSIENIDEYRLKLDGTPLKHRVHERFNYLIILPPSSSAGLTEYRTDAAGRIQNNFESATPGFIKTVGFATMPLLLAASHQAVCDLRYLGTQILDGRRTAVIAFAGHPDPKAVTGEFVLETKKIPVIWQGVAWLDSETAQILRMRTDLLAPLPFAGLTQATTVASYRAVHFSKQPAPVWLPSEVEVTAEIYGHTYLNRHTYSDYQLFAVEAKEPANTAPPAQPPAPPQ